MCLFLTSESVRLKKNFKRRKRPIIAYKLLKKGYDINGYISESDLNDINASIIYRSIFQDFIWEKDKYVTDYKRNNYLSSLEIKRKTILYGFHFYLNKENINKCKFNINQYCPMMGGGNECSYFSGCNRSNIKFYLCKFEIDPKDIVAIGAYNYGDKIDSLVSSGAKLVKVLD